MSDTARRACRLIGEYALLADGLVSGGAIDIDSAGRIAAVGTETTLGATEAPVHRIGGMLLPGLVNAHAHTPMTLVRSAGDGLPLQEWLTQGVWPREAKLTADDAYWGMTVGWAEMLLAGVTTTCEMYLHEDAIVRSSVDAGGRLVMTPGIIAALAPNGSLDGRLDEITEFHQKQHRPDDGVSVGFGPHSLYDLSPEQITEVGERAAQLDALVHIHLEETQRERAQVLEQSGRTATEVLADAGVLNGRVLAAHGVWLSDSDLALLGENGAAVAHCPLSNLKLGSGIARVPAMLEAGVAVGLGTDGVASNDNLNLWEELKIAPLLARGSQLDAQAMSAEQAFHLATRGAAKALGLDDVGALEAGCWADVVRLDLDQPIFANRIESELFPNAVYAGAAAPVTDVWVGGRRLVKDRQCTTIDVGAALEQAKRRSHALL